MSQLQNVEQITRCDVTKETDVKNALNICKDKFGKLDFCINCAGAAIAYVVYNHNRDYWIAR